MPVRSMPSTASVILSEATAARLAFLKSSRFDLMKASFSFFESKYWSHSYLCKRDRGSKPR